MKNVFTNNEKIQQQLRSIESEKDVPRYYIGIDVSHKVYSYSLIRFYDGRDLLLTSKVFDCLDEGTFRRQVDTLAEVFNATIIQETK